MTGITRRSVLRVAGPVVLQNATVPLLGAVALAVLVPVAGNHGLRAALMVPNATRTGSLWRRYPMVPALAARG